MTRLRMFSDRVTTQNSANSDQHLPSTCGETPAPGAGCLFTLLCAQPFFLLHVPRGETEALLWHPCSGPLAGLRAPGLIRPPRGPSDQHSCAYSTTSTYLCTLASRAPATVTPTSKPWTSTRSTTSSPRRRAASRSSLNVDPPMPFSL